MTDDASTLRAARRRTARLRTVKVVHTVVWAFFASCVVGILIAAAQRRVGLAAVLIACVAVETLVLAFNRWTCPLTGIAARYTAERQDNFDIYLPLWLARYNKHVFGTLYVIGIVWTALVWLRPAGA